MWEVSWRRRQTGIYWPQVLLTIAAILSHSGRATQPWVTESPSPLSGAGSHSGILSPTDSNCNWNCNWLKPSVASGYIIAYRPTASYGRTHLPTITEFNHVHRSRWYSDIIDRMHLFRCSSASLDWRLGRGSICYKFWWFLSLRFLEYCHLQCYSHNNSADKSYGLLLMSIVEFAILHRISNWTFYLTNKGRLF